MNAANPRAAAFDFGIAGTALRARGPEPWIAPLQTAWAADAAAAEAWTEGKHYFRLAQATPPRPGAVTVTEVFSYGCPACNAFMPYMESLEKKLPAGVTAEYVPASWSAAENWPTFQRAYLTAKALGVSKQAHTAMYQAIWGPNGELAIMDSRTGRIRSPLPSIADIARFYERVTKVPAPRPSSTICGSPRSSARSSAGTPSRPRPAGRCAPIGAPGKTSAPASSPSTSGTRSR